MGRNNTLFRHGLSCKAGYQLYRCDYSLQPAVRGTTRSKHKIHRAGLPRLYSATYSVTNDNTSLTRLFLLSNHCMTNMQRNSPNTEEATNLHLVGDTAIFLC